MQRYCFTLAVTVVLYGMSARAEEPKPIQLTLSPAKLPTPALRYQLLPDARIITSCDAAPIYRQAIELLEKKQFKKKVTRLESWTDLPLDKLPRDDMRKALGDYEDIYDLLDKAARCDHCSWGILERLREKGINAQLPETGGTRELARLLALRVRLEIADGHLEKAISAVQNGLALGRRIGEADKEICFIVGCAICHMMKRELDLLVAQPEAPNLYFALTDLPVPLLNMRRAIHGTRMELYSTFPGLLESVLNLNAGSLTQKQIEDSQKLLGKLLDVTAAEELRDLSKKFEEKHEIAKKALVAAGRPADKVDAMPQIQVALLHAVLEYDTAFEAMIVWHNLSYWEFSDHLIDFNKQYHEMRRRDPKAPVIPLTPLFTPLVGPLAKFRARQDRNIAILRTVEAIRLYAALHDGKLPPSLAAIKEVPIPLDPMTGKDFEYQVKNDTATLRAPPPGKEAANSVNSVVYELRIRKER